MKSKFFLIFLVFVIILPSISKPTPISNISKPSMIMSDIINENKIMNDTITISSGETLEIRNSVLDFTQIKNESFLIQNQGNLRIINSTILRIYK